MKLVDNWLAILKRAWSMRLMFLAAVLSGIEVILPSFSEAIPRDVFAVCSFLSVSGAFVARLIAQKDLK